LDTVRTGPRNIMSSLRAAAMSRVRAAAASPESGASPRAPKAYNTDWSAALDAVEAGLGGARPLAGRRVVVLGAGGTGRALAFGAQQRGASVVIANRCAWSLPTLSEGPAAALRDRSCCWDSACWRI